MAWQVSRAMGSGRTVGRGDGEVIHTDVESRHLVWRTGGLSYLFCSCLFKHGHSLFITLACERIGILFSRCINLAVFFYRWHYIRKAGSVEQTDKLQHSLLFGLFASWPFILFVLLAFSFIETKLMGRNVQHFGLHIFFQRICTTLDVIYYYLYYNTHHEVTFSLSRHFISL